MALESNSRSDKLTRRLLLCAIALGACALVALCLRINSPWLQDDSFITLRYAAHLAAGHGPVWNIGETPVEGFTSPLHMMLVALLLRLHVPAVIAVRMLGFAFHAGLVLYIGRSVRRSHGVVAGTLAAALVAASWPLLLWDLGGLDAVPFAAVADIGVLLALSYINTGRLRSLLQGGIVLGVACFLRPDGAVLAATALLGCVVLGPGKFAQRLRHVALAAALCGAVVLPWQVFRLAYFHAWLPNTWYDKVYGIPLTWRMGVGLAYLRSFMLKAPYLAPALGLVVLSQILRRRWPAFDRALLFVLGGYAVYVVDCGGDHMPGFRFLVPVIPLMAVALVRGLAELDMLRSTPLAWGLAAALLTACGLQATVQQLDLRAGDGTEMLGTEVGRYIDARWPAGATVGVNAAGATPFFADRLRYIDMLGLNDVVIAHRHPIAISTIQGRPIGHLKGDGRYVFARRPEFIIVSGPAGRPAAAAGGLSMGDSELLSQQDFAQFYEPCRADIPLSPYNLRHLRLDHPATSIPFFYFQRRDVALPCTPDPMDHPQ